MKLRIRKLWLVVCMAALALFISNSPSLVAVATGDTTSSTYSEEDAYASVQNLFSTVMSLTDDEIAYYLQSEYSMDVLICQQWQAIKDDLGEFVEYGEHQYETTSEGVVVTLYPVFENGTVDFSITLDSSGAIGDVSITMVKESGSDKFNFKEYMENLKETIPNALLNTVMGMGTVFIVLILISFIISLFKYIPVITEKFSKKKDEDIVTTAVTNTISQIEEKEDLVDDLELVAVITAAIAAMENTSSDGFVVRSIKRSNKSKWQKA